jgi:hypothetical protein
LVRNARPCCTVERKARKSAAARNAVARRPLTRSASHPAAAAVAKVRSTPGSLSQNRSNDPTAAAAIPCQKRSGGLVFVIPVSERRGRSRPDARVTRAIWR